jgi:hypothetical protein
VAVIAVAGRRGRDDAGRPSFNPAAVDGLMCRSTLSVGWDGRLHDCDFNQMLDLGTDDEAPQTIFNATPASLLARRIAVGPHCFGCTAGAGSSCGGATTPDRPTATSAP